MRYEQFGFRPRHSTSLQLVRLVEKIARNFGEKRLTGAVFLDVAKTFDTHPPYSPDLAPCDFFLFPKLKTHLEGQFWDS